MPIAISGAVGPQAANARDGAALTVRQGSTGDVVVSEFRGRFYEAASRGVLFRGGMSTTSINNATFTTLTNTTTPIVGVYNPVASGVKLAILQASVTVIITAATNTGGGPFVWAVSTSNSAISTGGAPWNCATLAQSGSQAKNMAGVALTGLTNNLVIIGGSSLSSGSAFNFSTVDTAVGFNPTNVAGIENFDGSLIIPPGGVLALLATTTPVAQSAASNLLWEEIPV